MKSLRQVIFFVSLIILAVSFVRCSPKYLVASGNTDYDNLSYASAIEKYKKVLAKDPTYQEAKVMLGRSYMNIREFENAESIYKDLANGPNASANDKFTYAKLLMSADKHKEAEAILRNYLLTNPDDKVAKSLLESCQYIELYKDDTTNFKITQIPLFTNTSMFSPVKYKDGLAFTSDHLAEGKEINPWTGNSYYNVYYTKNGAGNWGNPIEIEGDINARFHDGPITFNKDFTKAVFTRSYSIKDYKKQGKNDENFNNLYLYEAQFVGGKWTNVKALPFNNENYSNMHPALSKDGNTLYFSSDKPNEGMGGFDLYTSTFDGTTWSKPVNMGPDINTSGSEVFPNIVDDLLYFSSDGHPSLGGLDIFKTKKEVDGWRNVRNMNYPINSVSDDFSFILENGDSVGFFASKRGGTDRIYEFKKAPTGKVYVNGVIKRAGTDELLPEVAVTLKDLKTGEELKVNYTDAEGKFDFELKPNRVYEIQGRKAGFFSTKYERSTLNQYYDDEVDIILEMEEIITAADDSTFRYSLENIYYDLNSAKIRKDATTPLDKLATLLKENPSIEIELHSHTDSRGTDEYNLNLSNERAKSAIEYLKKKGIKSSRLSSKGFGETKLINQCGNDVECTDEEHQVNRRTEFIITKAD